MARAFLKDGNIAELSFGDWCCAAFMLQMYATGFVTVVPTPGNSEKLPEEKVSEVLLKLQEFD